jgi:hypothetical protein
LDANFTRFRREISNTPSSTRILNAHGVLLDGFLGVKKMGKKNAPKNFCFGTTVIKSLLLFPAIVFSLNKSISRI